MEAFLGPRPISDLPKVGPRVAEKLLAAGFRTCGDLQGQTSAAPVAAAVGMAVGSSDG